MYRGLRLKDWQKEDYLKYGMSYYWKEPKQAINDIFRALEINHKISQLGRNGLLRSLIMEGAEMDRLQVFGTESRTNAESYAKATPELIFLVLDYSRVERRKIIKYLNNTYGLPHIVTFNIEAPPTFTEEINKTCGIIIPPEFIVSIEPVDISKPDPYLQTLKSISSKVEIPTILTNR